MGDEATPNISRIPVKGGIGALILIVILLVAMAVDIPSLRSYAFWGLGIGLVLAVVLIMWRRPHG